MKILIGLLLGWLFLAWSTPFEACRCGPEQPCWPSEEQWQAFNNTVDGNLIKLAPVGNVCHESTFDEESCREFLHSNRNSGWRASQPGALQDWLWESGSSTNETCDVLGPKVQGALCHQGRIPLYSVAVESVAHIKSSISFTRKHNLRLVIRNTGHDGAGRSSGPDSLQIDTHRMKEITYHHDFTPIGSVVSGEGPAVTVEAGVMLGDLYAQGAHHGYTVVGGECPTVGATGGFVLGGGVSSILSHTRGLAVDNVLEYEIVTASGDLVIANAHQNKDLFWALRGGGGATFGITTRVTVRAFPDVPICTEKFVLQGPYHEPTFWKHGVQPLLETLQSLNRKGIVGQFELTRPSEELAQTSLEVFFLERKKDYVPDDDIRQLKDKLSSSDGGNAIHHSVQSRCLPNLNSALRHAPDIYPPDYGVLFGSILISTSMFNSSKGPREISENFARFSLHPGDLLFTSNLGGRVSEIPERADSETSMHPGWRSSSQLLTYVRYVGGLSVERKESALFELTNVQMPHLYSLEPDFNVSYVNLPDPNQPGAPRIFWGKSYDYLLKLKQIWDPEEIFITRLGVGSENWDVEGMCKLNRGSIHRVNSLLPLDWLRY